MTVLVAQIGARRHYAVPAALEQAGLLAGLYTDVCMAAPWWRLLGKAFPGTIPLPGWKSFRGREPAGVPDEKVTCLWSSLWTMWRIRRLMAQGGQYECWTKQNEAFGRDVVQLGFGSANCVYAFNGAAIEIFEAARRSGLKCILDMTIAPLEVVEKLLTEERERFSRLEIGTQIANPADTLIARERREWELADIILCGSEYVADSLAEVGVPASKCRVVRWGYTGASTVPPRPQNSGPLRILIAGTVELRKGIPYALEAAQLLSDARYHFRFVGPVRLDTRVITEQYTNRISGTTIEFVGPIPRSEMTREYQNADVLLHPSLAEGSANVCYEAMAHGLPVIATPNAGAAITDGVEGLIIPIRSSAAIASSLQRLANDPALCHSMGQAGRLRASTLTITEYRQELSRVIESVSPPQSEPRPLVPPPQKV